MALTIVMQDLVTVAIDQATIPVSVIQPEADWVDLGAYQDLLLYAYISAQGSQAGANAAGTLYFETSPVKEDAVFRQTSLASIPSNATPQYWGAAGGISPFHLSTGNSGFARYLRWHLVGPTANGTATWTFRLLLSVNPAPR